MEIGRIRGATRIFAQHQDEYFTLPVRDVVEDGHSMMQTAWFPTPDELAKLNAGAPIVLSIMGTTHPPVRLDVGDLPDEGGGA